MVAPRQVLNKTVGELTPRDHPLIFAVNMSTGKQFHANPTEVPPAPPCLPYRPMTKPSVPNTWNAQAAVQRSSAFLGLCMAFAALCEAQSSPYIDV